MLKMRKLAQTDGGQAAVTLAVVVVAVLVSAFLLFRTLSNAVEINKKAGLIRESGRSINTATDSILQLKKTNRLATSILGTAESLGGEGGEGGQVQKIVDLAKSIDSLVTSITATAGTINSTATSINGEATRILGTARNIAADVRLINQGLDVTIPIARDIKADTGAIVGYARSIHGNLARLAVGGDGHG